MKKLITWILVFICVLIIVGCSNHMTFDINNASRLNIKSPFGEVYIRDSETVQRITENINSLRFEKTSEANGEEDYVYLLTWFDAEDKELESIAITEENGYRIRYNGYYYKVGADLCIDVELIKDEVFRIYSSSVLEGERVIEPLEDETQMSETSEVASEKQIVFDEVVQAYHQASEAASWFRIASLPEDGSQGAIDMSDQVIENDLTYFRVKQFDSYSGFIDYLGTLFSDEMIESFLAYNGHMYIEHNGYLYGRFGMRGTNIFMGEEIYHIEYVDNGKVHLLVIVEVMNEDLSAVKEYQTFIFPYENIEGKWVFTDFPEIR